MKGDKCELCGFVERETRTNNPWTEVCRDTTSGKMVCHRCYRRIGKKTSPRA